MLPNRQSCFSHHCYVKATQSYDIRVALISLLLTGSSLPDLAKQASAILQAL